MADSEYLNVVFKGVTLGKVCKSGDPVTDAAACRQLMESLGYKLENTKAQQMLGVAVGFNETAAALHARMHRDVHDPRPMIPYVVNAAFSIEVFLKTIAEAYGAALRGHDLVDLYRKLPAPAREAIQAAAPDLVGRYRIDPQRDFASLLEGLSSAFVKWRYAWEIPEGVGYFGIAEATAVLHVLHHVCHAAVWGSDWSTRTGE